MYTNTNNNNNNQVQSYEFIDDYKSIKKKSSKQLRTANL